MNIRDYIIRADYQSHNEELMEAYDAAMEKLNKTTERFAKTDSGYDISCYKVYLEFLETTNKFMASFLDYLKAWHEKFECFEKLFKYDESLCEKLTHVNSGTEKVFDVYFHMIETLDGVKDEFETKLRQFMLGEKSDVIISKEEMEDCFRDIAAYHFDLVQQTNNFAEDVGIPQIELQETIFDVDLDFNQAIEKNKLLNTQVEPVV